MDFPVTETLSNEEVMAVKEENVSWFHWIRGRLFAAPLGALQAAAEAVARMTPKGIAERKRFLPLRVDPDLRKRLQELLNRAGPRSMPGNLDRCLDRIQAETDRHNRNNLTRTAAYLSFFRRHPEVHWAFLAHMVSRNGGWNMTDLKGGLLSKLLGADVRNRLFDMLEQSNASIFGDAYPQLLLYEESLRAGKPLFHLLQACGVSRFMHPVWELFWEARDSVLLTMALIVNEQHVVEKRVLGRPAMREHAVGTLPFQAQSAMQFNQVFFPYEGEGVQSKVLAGLTVENFANVKERIAVGRTLYAVLYGIPEVAEGARRFAERTPHSGSRADYWPGMFTSVQDDSGGRFYSPRLEDAWKDQPLRRPERLDWFRSAEEACGYLRDTSPPYPYEMSGAHRNAYRKLVLAVRAAELAGIR